MKSHSAAETSTKPSNKYISKELQPHNQLPAVPYFIPLVHGSTLDAESSKLPVFLAILEPIELIHVFKLFMNDPLFELIATNTNLYAQKRMSESDSSAS